jgi:hypothetical protein
MQERKKTKRKITRSIPNLMRIPAKRMLGSNPGFGELGELGFRV